MDAIDLTVLGNRVLAVCGQGDMVWGHLAVRDPDGRGVWMKSSGWGFEEVTRDRVMLVSWDGDVLAGYGKRHLEYPIHTEIMRARPDVNATLHTHPDTVNAFSAKDVPLRPISHDATAFAEHGVPRYRTTANLVRTAELGRALADDLGPAHVCLMPQHGLAATGSDVAHAVMYAILLQRACATQLLAGDVKAWTPDEEALEKAALVWADSQIDAGWQYWVRRLESQS